MDRNGAGRNYQQAPELAVNVIAIAEILSTLSAVLVYRDEKKQILGFACGQEGICKQRIWVHGLEARDW